MPDHTDTPANADTREADGERRDADARGQETDADRPDPDALARERAALLYVQHTDTVCPQCRYPIGGIDRPVCPECGHRLTLELHRKRGVWSPRMVTIASALLCQGPWLVPGVFAGAELLSYMTNRYRANYISQVLVVASAVVLSMIVTACLVWRNTRAERRHANAEAPPPRAGVWRLVLAGALPVGLHVLIIAAMVGGFWLVDPY